MPERPLIDLWKWLGYEDKAKDKESARRVNESAETYKRQREIDSTARRSDEKAAFDQNRQRFLEAHINANRDNPDAVGLAEAANKDWAKAVASGNMPNVLNYEETTAKIPGAGASAKEKQRAETNKATVEADRAEGKKELASKAGEDEIKSEIAKNFETTAKSVNEGAKATAKTDYMPGIGAAEGEGEQDELFNRKKNMEETDRIRQRLSPDAPYYAEAMRAAQLGNAQNQASLGKSTAGLANIQYDIGQKTQAEQLETTAKELGARKAVAEQLVQSPQMKFPGYDPMTQLMLQRMGLGMGGGPPTQSGVWADPRVNNPQPADSTARPALRPKRDMEW